MNEYDKQRKIAYIFLGISIGVPFIVMFWEPAVGGFLFFIGAITSYRAMSALRATENDIRPAARKIDKAGKTILVQIVDGFGRDLLPQEVERRLAEARSKADLRDTIVPARFRVAEE